MPVLIFLPFLVFAVPVIVRLLRPCRMSEITPEWLENFQASSYYPMNGLLAADDFQFLTRQPGFESSLVRKLRRDRLIIFRQYLNRLVADFNRLHKVAILVVTQTNQDNSEVFMRLIKLRIRFSLTVLRVEFCYSLCRLGVGSLSVGALLAQFDEMASQLSVMPKIRLSSANL
jgi:hypothetical protein